MKILKNVGGYFIILMLSYFTASPLGKLLFPSAYSASFSSFAVPEYWYYFSIGAVLSYIFFLFLLFTAFGGPGKYLWSGLLSVPALAFSLYFDPLHIYFPIALGIIGWMIGIGIAKIIHYYKK